MRKKKQHINTKFENDDEDNNGEEFIEKLTYQGKERPITIENDWSLTLYLHKNHFEYKTIN